MRQCESYWEPPRTELIETVRFMLDLPPMQSRQKAEQVKAYFSAVKNPHNLLHEAVKDTEGCRLGRGKSWTEYCKYAS